MERYILGYVTDGSLETVTAEDAGRLTHINLAFGVIRDGLLDMSHMPHIGEVDRIRRLNPKLKFVLSVGGWGAGGFSVMSRTEEGRQAFARSVGDAVRTCGLDGIDIDWEYPCSDAAGIDCDPSDKENYTYLLQALRDVVGPDRIVSIAAGAGDYFVRNTEMDKVAQICDYVQIMTYDMNAVEHTACHHTALYDPEGREREGNAAYAVRIFHEAGVPMEKIVIGAAFYSRMWKGVKPERGGLLQEAESLGLYGPAYGDLIRDHLGKNGYEAHWDDTAKAPWLFDGSTFISYDDPASIREKCRFVKKMGLKGIMYWEHACDPTGTLLGAMYAGLREEA